MNILELFPCSGGMAEGARRAGLEVGVSFDWSRDACDSYEANHGRRPIQMDVDDLLRMVRDGWGPCGPRHFPTDGAIDLLIADPPCTPWSRAGSRLGTDDERDMLEATVELVALLRPRSYLIANVPGLDDGPNWPVVQRTIGSLAEHGYCVVDFARLDAADFGVPQHRVRPFWFGHLDGPCLIWPGRTHGAAHETAPTLPGVPRLLPYVTCRDALKHLSNEDLGKPIKLRLRLDALQRPSCADEPAKTLTCNDADGGALLMNERHPVSSADAPSYTITSRGPGRGAQGGCVLAPWPWDWPSTTVTTRDVVPPPGHQIRSRGSVLSQPGAIKLSEKAASILQGFPESWRFCGRTKEARWNQIGMAMPPGLAEPVFRAIARARGRVRRVA